MELTGPPALLRLDGSIIVPHMLHGNQIVPTDLFCLSVDRSSLRSHGGRKLVAPHITDMNRRVAYSAFKVREECLLTSSLTLRGEKIAKLVLIPEFFSKIFSANKKRLHHNFW